MSEWWTYRLSDFLMFSPRTYWRMVALYNQQYWPAQLLLTSVGLGALRLAHSPAVAAGRALAILLALAWLWVGWAFHWQRYAAINWAASYLAVACGLQAMLLLSLGMMGRPAAAATQAHAAQGNGWPGKLGWTLATAGVVYPLATLIAGREWAQAEVWGLVPEPTSLLTLGLLLASPHFNRLTRTGQSCLMVVPVLSGALGAATYRAMAG
ncbi:MAG: conserved hypothetical rane protein [Polaromonas sp.]|nr:conserved hypothetical rane protein [Polaromonas sp.]